jgi:hypothetical protein
MKKLITEIHHGKNWQEQSKAAENEMPGTAFDRIFELIKTTNLLEGFSQTKGLRNLRIVTKNVDRFDACLGRLVREAVNQNQVQTLHEFASAVGLLIKHQPEPDHVLRAVTVLGGISPTEIALSYALGPVPVRNNEILWMPVPYLRKPKMADIKKIVEHSLGRKLTAGEWEKDSKKAERHMKALGYWEKFDHRGGRPKKTGTTKR